MKIVIVSPHPDDESIGAGGFILRHKKSGDKVYWINVTDVEENQGWSKEFVFRRREQIEDIIKFYNFDGFYNLKYKPSSLGHVDRGELIEAFSKLIKKIEPDWVVLPNPTDAHTDHMVTYEVGMTCTKNFRYPFVKKVMTMEIISETDFSKTGEAFSPNLFVDITDFIDEKINALKIYDTEFLEPPFPRSFEAIKALALLRGSTSGCKFAEAFKIIKEIEH